MTTENLKPCPFCGEHEGPDGPQIVHSDEVFVECESCHVFTGICENESEAVYRWNRRETKMLA